MTQIDDIAQEVDELREIIYKSLSDAANDRKRITHLENLENKEAKPSEKTDNHIDALAQYLQNNYKSGQRGITYGQAAKYLGISKSRVCQLRIRIARDPGFNITWHPNRKNTKIISLRK
jgi:hypothetical protein